MVNQSKWKEEFRSYLYGLGLKESTVEGHIRNMGHKKEKLPVNAEKIIPSISNDKEWKNFKDQKDYVNKLIQYFK